jgi:excisionase family DNA binding protein
MVSEDELTLEEAALRLGVGAEEVWALVREDVLPAREDDHGRRFIPAEAVDELAAASPYRDA